MNKSETAVRPPVLPRKGMGVPSAVRPQVALNVQAPPPAAASVTSGHAASSQNGRPVAQQPEEGLPRLPTRPSSVRTSLSAAPPSPVAAQLIGAVERNDVCAVMLLLSSRDPRLNVNEYCERGDTALTLAAHQGNVMITLLLLQKGADVNQPNRKGGYTPLHRACWAGHDDVAALLIEQGADVAAADADGYTPLHWAAWSGKMRCTELLVRAGAPVNQVDRYGFAPLHRAVADGHDECAFVLLTPGCANPLMPTQNEDRDTPLHLAARHDRFETLRLLLRFRVNLDALNGAGKTALQAAVSERCRALLMGGAPVSPRASSTTASSVKAPPVPGRRPRVSSGGALPTTPLSVARPAAPSSSAPRDMLRSSSTPFEAPPVSAKPAVSTGRPTVAVAAGGTPSKGPPSPPSPSLISLTQTKPRTSSLPDASHLFRPPSTAARAPSTLIASSAMSFAASPVRRWSIGAVGEWLVSVGFAQYAARFCDNEVDGQSLLLLSESDFLKLVGDAQTARHIMELVKQLN